MRAKSDEGITTSVTVGLEVSSRSEIRLGR